MIGVFDSGVGGLTVLTQIRQRVPDAALLYVADQAYSPYGDLSEAQVFERSRLITQWLIGQGCAVIVIACNTATAIAIDQLRSLFSIPIVGVEPGVKPAALSSRTGKVAILATENTLASQRYRRLMAGFLPNVTVLNQACSGLADAIEFRPTEIPALLDKYTSAFEAEGVDQVVLGCTHYPLIIEELKRVLPAAINIVDTSDAIAQEVARRAAPLLLTKDAVTVSLRTTAKPQEMERMIKRYSSLAWLQGIPAASLNLGNPE
ncbi:glutamate racemase [Reinekea sp. G2M2-21]|uniref:glutamate racemase n=1 Tax=Reinekea sp. G2M2-21 TaxID=2788942 RepID=UPI0018AA6AC9|nr:glutamate racemase [Reinekea sp. G2M2-21]